MKERFSKMYKELKANEDKIANDLIAVQGKPVDLGGYYVPDDKKALEVMRPSLIFNKIIDEM
jgi:isocitrate dehydrogenase